MFGLRMPELLIILGVVVVLFGGSKLPELGKGLGEGMKSFRKAMKEARADDDEEPATKSQKAS
ncbi:Sec-independent protein translocase subunit TatA/TatB [Anaeromyxobacter paludicola]|uniref:Sec-independent protein translocase protein TatA n=1 Tax=Anaeromyxobacter paludicola TaxID=2918171 RepID=A0ABN6N7L6_9BACT|nr:twin-arginine translocase TatA/TatE family subunit [Anaeromyxobacter paludicola]BDG08024.1 hypothetical protein AMPC_11370 [Anaeromyxobacter paludicola]